MARKVDGICRYCDHETKVWKGKNGASDSLEHRAFGGGQWSRAANYCHWIYRREGLR